MDALLSPHLPLRLEDGELARCIAAGDTLAFERLMRQHNRRLYRLARVTLRNDGDAEDALQEAYFQAFRAMGQFRGESSLATWLSQLVMNECLNRLRKQARRDGIAPMVHAELAGDDDALEAETDAMDAPFAERPDDALARSQLRALIERRLDDLPEAFSAVFVLRGVEELSVEETAQSLGIPEATVRSRYFRARGLLRKSLAADIDVAQQGVFSFDGARCDRIVATVLQRLHNQRLPRPPCHDPGPPLTTPSPRLCRVAGGLAGAGPAGARHQCGAGACAGRFLCLARHLPREHGRRQGLRTQTHREGAGRAGSRPLRGLPHPAGRPRRPVRDA